MADSFRLEEVAGGVWAAIAPSTAGPAVSNAAIIDLGDRTVVVDTFMTVQAATELADAAQRLTGREAFLVVNSHWHSDHIRGNPAFAATPIVGTARMRELILDDSPTSAADFHARAAAVERAAGELRANATSDADRTRAAGMSALARALAAEAATYRVVVPNVLIGDRLDIEGKRRAIVLGAGAAHTESDLFVYIPDAHVIVAGDLLWTGVHPKAGDGFPRKWAAELAGLADLEPAVVIAGHGPTGTVSDLGEMRRYLDALDGIVAAVRAGDADPATVDPPTGSEEWADIARFRSSVADLVTR